MNRAFRTRQPGTGGRTGVGGGANANSRGIGIGDNSAVINRSIKEMVEAVVAHELPPFYMADREGHLVYANRAFLELTGLEAGIIDNVELLRQQVPAFLADSVAYVLAEEKPLLAREQLDVLGKSRHFDARHFPIFDNDDLLVAVGGTYFDVTRRTDALDQARNERQRFDDIIRSTSDWVWEIDAAGAITFISDRITETLGQPAALLKGRRFLDLGRFVAAEGGDDGHGAMERQAPFRNALFMVRDHQGRRRSYNLSAVPIFDDGGNFGGYRGTGSDVTALKSAQTAADKSRAALEQTLEELTSKNIQLDLALEQAQAATQAKGEFLAAMSHELRTPLNAVLGFSEVMTMAALGPLSETYQSYATNIQKAGRHLLAIIDDVLEVARMEGDSFDIHAQPTDLAAIVNDAFVMISEQARGKKLDTSAISCVSRTIHADPQRTTQIFVNLLGNAVKFTPAGGRIGVDVEDTGPDAVTISVWDTGIGIPHDQHERVFDKFHQVHNGIHSRVQEGAGLGLTISRHLARMMGGDISIASVPGEGCRFMVRLPLRA